MTTRTQRSPMDAWDTDAAVRTRQYRLSPPPSDEWHGHFFRPALMRVLRHPDLADISEADRRQLELRQLSHYMHATEKIETCLVNPALAIIVDLEVPAAIRLDALRIYTDEGYHALMSAELRRSIVEAYASVPVPEAFPVPLRHLLDHIGRLPPPLGPLALVTAASLNETMISGNLAQANDDTLAAPVRHLIGTHAVDEARHHAYFLKAFPLIWRLWPAEERARVVDLLPWMLQTLLAPDTQALGADLQAVGFGADRARTIVEEAYAERSRRDLEAATRGSLDMLRRAGLAVRDAAMRDRLFAGDADPPAAGEYA